MLLLQKYSFNGLVSKFKLEDPTYHFKLFIFLLNPEYMRRLFQPDRLWLPVVAILMQIAGFLVIRRIVDIEV